MVDHFTLTPIAGLESFIRGGLVRGQEMFPYCSSESKKKKNYDATLKYD